jgi:raffinose/stachyose/melibiose transport system substrate-binding protein
VYTRDAAEAAAFAAGLEDIKALYKDGLLYSQATTKNNGDAFDAFLNNRAAFYVGGSWSYNTDKSNISITYFPAKAGSNRKNTDAIGGISMGYAISRKAYEDPSKRDNVVKFVDTLTSAGALLSFGEWRSYTLSADAVANKTRAYVPNRNDWLTAKRVDDIKEDDHDYDYSNPLSETLKSACAFNVGVTMFQGAVQDSIPPAAKAILFEQAPSFFKGTGTAAQLIATVNSTHY